jgi:uncharacterized protein (DUF849 family)
MSEYLPITPEQIGEQSIAAVEAGAAVLHLHARKPESGEPTGDPDIFACFLPVIRKETNAVINLTTGGSPAMSVQERLGGGHTV